jgi:ABC-2 type transport system permease protein
MPIFDQGYQHWKGSLSGRFWRCLAITQQGLRGQMAAKRSFVRLVLLGAWAPPLALVVVLCVWGLFEQKSETVLNFLQPLLPKNVSADPCTYRRAIWTIAYSIFFRVELYIIMVLVMLVGPNLISLDLRFNALPLYFSRPITRLEYFLGKLGVVAALVAAVAVLPAVAAYLLGVCFSLDLNVIRDTWRLLPASILYGLILVASAGTLILALSSMSRRSLYVGIAWVGIWITGAAVSTGLDGMQQRASYQQARQELQQAAANRPQGDFHFDPDDPSTHGQRPRPVVDDWPAIYQRAKEIRDEAARHDWRPLCSYVANLRCLGDNLLDADRAWVEVGRAADVPRQMARPFFRRGMMGPPDERQLANWWILQHPWTWSASVLAGLFVLSICILSTRVRSLDRLK